MTESRMLVLQHEYNQKRSHDADQWGWVDAGIILRGSTREEQLADAKAWVQSRCENKFIRGWRVVERVLVCTESVIEEIPANG